MTHWNTTYNRKNIILEWYVNDNIQSDGIASGLGQRQYEVMAIVTLGCGTTPQLSCIKSKKNLPFTLLADRA